MSIFTVISLANAEHVLLLMTSAQKGLETFQFKFKLNEE